MKQSTSHTGARDSEIAELIAVLHETEQRLDTLTAGEIDAVFNSDGQLFLLRRAQEKLRLTNAAKQSGILDALPANIALLDQCGIVVSVNDRWRAFARANGYRGLDYGIGADYVETCRQAKGADSSGAATVADGILSVLEGQSANFSFEYSCNSPEERRWFEMMATPLAGQSSGVVVMHVDITERKFSEQRLQESERRFSEMLGNIELISVMVDRDARITYCNPYLLRISGRNREDVIGHDWYEVLAAPDTRSLKNSRFPLILAGDPEAMHGESEILLATGESRLIRWNHTLLRSDLGMLSGPRASARTLPNVDVLPPGLSTSIESKL
jgi:PAS domain S-box-containing protein